MNKILPIMVLVLFVCGCQASIRTPLTPTTVFSPISTPTVRPGIITPSLPTPTTGPTSELIGGWLVYHNNLLGYEFSYPAEAVIDSMGPDSYSPDDVPPDIKFDYFKLLESIYPDDLCVGLSYKTGFIIISAPLNRGGKFVTCGVTGVGDYDIVQKSETVIIGKQPYTAKGYQVHERNPSATSRSEFFYVQLEDRTRINYGGFWAEAGATYDSYVPVKEILRQILASYRQVLPAQTCASNWSQLYPGAFALVAGEPANWRNRVRSLPNTSATIVTEIDPGEIVLVIEGPACANNLVFWKVRSDVIPGGVGWTAEGDGKNHYLVPYHSPSAPP